MNRIFLFVLVSAGICGCTSGSKIRQHSPHTVPALLKGNFKDDYGETYSIDEKTWLMKPGIRYHLLTYDSAGQYFVAKNDTGNPSEPDLYTRIDIMYFSNMEPWLWGFCLTNYKAKSFEEAESTAAADRANPRKGCNGYPFSRMKRD